MWKIPAIIALSGVYRLSYPISRGSIVDNSVHNRGNCPHLGWPDVGNSVIHISTRLTTTTISFQKSKGALFVLVPVDNLTSHSYLRREPIYRGLTSPISIHSGIPIKNRVYSRRGICAFSRDRGSSTAPPFRKRLSRTSGPHLQSTCHTSFPSVRIHTAPLRAVLWTSIP